MVIGGYAYDECIGGYAVLSRVDNDWLLLRLLLHFKPPSYVTPNLHVTPNPSTVGMRDSLRTRSNIVTSR